MLPKAVHTGILRNLISTPLLQPVWAQLLKLCHAGLNYGGGQIVTESGELHALRFAEQTLGHPRPFVLFDVGANTGSYLQQALDVFGKDVTAYAFEPQSGSFKRLREKMSCISGVHLWQAAVGKEPGQATLEFRSDLDIGASIRSGGEKESVFLETVPVVTLDQFCQQQNVPRIDLLKIDTEGYEMEVLLGASKMMEKGAIGSVQFEFGETLLTAPYHFIDFWRLLSPRFTIYRILRHGLEELREYTVDLEIYKLANFLGIQRLD